MSFLMQNGEVLYRGKVRKMDVLVDDLGRVTAADQIDLTAEDVNWIPFDAPPAPLRCRAKIRYHAAPASCTVTPLPGGRAAVVFDEPQRSVTPGQSAVFYDGDRVLGGGIIEGFV